MFKSGVPLSLTLTLIHGLLRRPPTHTHGGNVQKRASTVLTNGGEQEVVEHVGEEDDGQYQTCGFLRLVACPPQPLHAASGRSGHAAHALLQ